MPPYTSSGDPVASAQTVLYGQQMYKHMRKALETFREMREMRGLYENDGAFRAFAERYLERQPPFQTVWANALESTRRAPGVTPEWAASATGHVPEDMNAWKREPDWWELAVVPTGRSVSERLAVLFASGRCERTELGEDLIERLQALDDKTACAILDAFECADLRSIRNKRAFFEVMVRHWRV